MFIKTYNPQPVSGTKKIKMQCAQCNNESEHQVYEDYHGPQIGFIFLKKPILSMKKYYLVCPICMNPAKEISKDQMNALRQ